MVHVLLLLPQKFGTHGVERVGMQLVVALYSLYHGAQHEFGY